MLSAVFYLARVALAGIRLLFQRSEHENGELIDFFKRG